MPRSEINAEIEKTETMSPGLLDLDSLVDYEVRCSTRYRRCLSLILIVPVNRDVELKEMLKEVLRKSDEFFEFRSQSAVVMGETNCAGALAAVERYKQACGEDIDLRAALASFPVDGLTTTDLLQTAQRRLSEALKLERGAVVASG